jgi:chemotaxis protein methyltransferase CheR
MLHDKILTYFAQFIEKELGIIYAEHNYFQLQNRLEEIAKLQGKSSIEQLYDEAQKGIQGSFKQLLLDVATNNETSFFRDPKVFKAVEAMILNEYHKKTPLRPKLNIWSAASSTGQESVSTAILIKEFSAKMGLNVNFNITATDISERVLTRAKKASYSQLEVQRGMSAALLIKYFTKDVNDSWNVISEIKNSIQFKTQNLKENFNFPEPFDLVLCRNVLIYQNVEGKKEILSRITKTLMPGGYLIMGSGESLLGLSNDYESVSSEGAVIYRKKMTSLIKEVA